MNNLRNNLFIAVGFLILILDIILMNLWIRNIKPDPFMSNGIENYKLEIFGINILLAIIIFFIRKKFSILFIANTLICYWIFSFFWNSWIEDNPYSSSVYAFNIENRRLKIKIDKNPDIFRIVEEISGSEDSLITTGMHEKVGDSIKLTSMHETMYFSNDRLTGFSLNSKEIKVYEIE